MVFNLNHKNLYQIDTKGGNTKDSVTEATWALMAGGISSITQNAADTVDNQAYYDGDGESSSDVTGLNDGFAFTGNRNVGDTAQDFIVSLKHKTGEGRKVNIRHTSPDGTVETAQYTLSNIVITGGAANAKETLSFTAGQNGRIYEESTTPAPNPAG